MHLASHELTLHPFADVKAQKAEFPGTEYYNLFAFFSVKEKSSV